MTADNNPAPTSKDGGDISHPEMITIPAGSFRMGTSDDQIHQLMLQEEWANDWDERDLFKSEQPQHKLTLPAFELSRYPITNAQYHAFVWETGHRVPHDWAGFRIPEGMQAHPVVQVSQQDAISYCHWLSEKTGRVIRLPSEAEWERAARGDTDRNYPWGSYFELFRCNTSESKKKGTTPVGYFSPSGDSPFHAADLSGNVWEWTRSQLMPYPYDGSDGRERKQSGAEYVVRGGSWYYSHKLARCSSREGMLAGVESPLVGFRIVRTHP